MRLWPFWNCSGTGPLGPYNTRLYDHKRQDVMKSRLCQLLAVFDTAGSVGVASGGIRSGSLLESRYPLLSRLSCGAHSASERCCGGLEISRGSDVLAGSTGLPSAIWRKRLAWRMHTRSSHQLSICRLLKSRKYVPHCRCGQVPPRTVRGRLDLSFEDTILEEVVTRIASCMRSNYLVHLAPQQFAAGPI